MYNLPFAKVYLGRLEKKYAIDAIKNGWGNNHSKYINLFEKKFKLLIPSKKIQINNVNKSIKYVKMGRTKEAEKALRPAIKYLLEENCKKIILGCTELPIAVFAYQSFKKAKLSKTFLDPNLILAEASMRKYKNS